MIEQSNVGQRGFFGVLTDAATGALSRGLETYAEASAIRAAGGQYVGTAQHTSSPVTSPEAEAAARAAARGTAPLSGETARWVMMGAVLLGGLVLVGGAAIVLRK